MSRIAVWLFALLACLYLLVARGRFLSSDEVTLYQVTRSIWESGDLAVAPSLRHASLDGNGAAYSSYSCGQSIAALPLYGLGKTASRLLERRGSDGALAALAGKVRGDTDIRWGGEVEILFTGFLNALVTALLGVVFFAFSLRLGTSARVAVATTAILAVASHLASFATSFYTHPAEALFLLWASYFLVADAERPSWRCRAAAGVLASLGLLFRVQAAVALPALALYLVIGTWARRRSEAGDARAIASALGAALPFAAAVALGLGLHLWINQVKSGGWVLLAGGYGREGLLVSPFRGLYGLLLSPGHSLFLFTPVLVLLPVTLPYLASRNRGLARLIAAASLSYLALYACYKHWHGLWCFGPRYLAAVVPLLLLPLGPWLEARRRGGWIAVLPLALLGIWLQAINLAVDFWRVAKVEGYAMDEPSFQAANFLFLPDARSPVVAHSRALLAGDDRVGLWLLDVARGGAPGLALALALALAAILGGCVLGLVRSLSRAERERRPGSAPSFLPLARPALAALALVVLATAAGHHADLRHRAALAAEIQRDHPATLPEAAVMNAGLAALYEQRRPERATALLRNLCQRDPGHYGATFQLARALEASGRVREAGVVWLRMLALAEAEDDRATAELARRRLGLGKPQAGDPR